VLLKNLTLISHRYAEVDGDVYFGSMTAKEATPYRGSIVINTEEELFYPSLTVGKTMDFATRLNIPNTLPSTAQNREDWRIKFKEFLLDSMGIAHTEDTKVGDAFVRGVSGGERKRVSIIETLCTRGSVMAWDNSVSRYRR
jgi:ABC-type multidrug transport system ATPase subunit